MSISNHDDSLNNDPEKLDRKLTEDSWENFIRDQHLFVPTDELRSRIEQKIGPIPVPAKKFRYAWPAVAASVILMAGSFVLTYKKNKPVPETLATVHPPAQKPLPIKEITNNAASTMSLLLPDGSKVALAGSSTLKYYTPFIGGKRDIYLTGAATFTVRKNKQMPFVVHTKDITTTVLGTVFSVSDKTNHLTKIRLFSGKVVIRKESPGASGDIYLKPGDELTIEPANFTYELKRPAPAAAIKTAKDSVQTDNSRSLAFDNQPLEQIFIQLQQNGWHHDRIRCCQLEEHDIHWEIQ